MLQQEQGQHSKVCRTVQEEGEEGDGMSALSTAVYFWSRLIAIIHVLTSLTNHGQDTGAGPHQQVAGGEGPTAFQPGFNPRQGPQLVSSQGNTSGQSVFGQAGQ